MVVHELRGQGPRGHRTKWFLKKGAAAWVDAAEWSSVWDVGLTYGLVLVQVVVDSGNLEVRGGVERVEEVQTAHRAGSFFLVDSL